MQQAGHPAPVGRHQLVTFAEHREYQQQAAPRRFVTEATVAAHQFEPFCQCGPVIAREGMMRSQRMPRRRVGRVLPRLVEQTGRLNVRDHGPGIPTEHVPRLTERFYRVNVEDSRSKKGTGLGLAIVKHILTRHRARLIVKSELGTGSEFTVRF